VLETISSLLYPAEPPVLGEREIIDKINSLDWIYYEEISAFKCYPNTSGFSTLGNSQICLQ